MSYRQLTPEERYMLAALRRQGLNQSQIARALGRHRSTVCREVRRNSDKLARVGWNDLFGGAFSETMLIARPVTA